MPAFYLLVLVKIAHSMNRFEFSLFGLTLPSLRRVASRPIPSRESSLFPISSHFFHRVCSGIPSAEWRGVSWPPAHPDALRRDAAQRVATRCGAACGKGSTREGRFPALRPKSRRSMGSPWRQTSPYLYSPRYFPMKSHGSAPCRPDCSRPFAWLARLAPLQPRSFHSGPKIGGLS